MTTVSSTSSSSSSAVSFQGLSSGLQTDSLVDALMEQASQPLYRLQAKQSLNKERASLVRTISADLTALNTDISNLNGSGFTANTVSSSDSNSTYVSATASGAAKGNYSLFVKQVAVAAQTVYSGAITASQDLGGSQSSDGKYHFSVTGTNGTSTDISTSTNTLQGLRDAINASSSTTGVAASLVQVDANGTQYALTISASKTGLGSTGGSTVSLAAASENSGSTITALTTAAAGSGYSKTVTNAQNAVFNVNGIELTRTSNTVTDAVEGMTISLKSAQAIGTPATTLTVATDKTALTKSMQNVVDKFNTLLKVYKDNSGQDSSGNALPLANDFTIRNLISTVRSKIMSVPTGLSSSTSFRSAADLGLKTNKDGTMSLDSAAFQAAVDKDPSGAVSVFNAIGSDMQAMVNQVTSPGSGNLALVLQSIDSQNTRLTSQISIMQTQLDRKKTILQNQYANLETTVGQLQSIAKSLTSLSSSSSSS